jgi:hypothetical protein
MAMLDRVLPLPRAAVSFSLVRLAAVVSVALWVAVLVVVRLDAGFEHRWFAFALWLTSLALVPLAAAVEAHGALREALLVRVRRPRAQLPFLALLLVAAVASFALLIQYPYVAIYDQVRDGGLNAQEILNGQMPNLFGFGRYGSHGAIIPTVAAAFYRLFGASVLSYRVPAALLALLDVTLLYVVMRRGVGRTAALFAGLALLTLPLHLFYGRTELVVICSSVLMTLLLLLLQGYLERPYGVNAALLGLGIGFAANFHAAIVTIAVTTLALVVLLAAWRWYCTRRLGPVAAGLALVLLFSVVGLGPKLLFITPTTFLHTDEAFSEKADAPPAQTGVGDTLQRMIHHPLTVGKNYLTSVRSYVDSPLATSHYPDWKPLLNPLVAELFLLGLVAAVLSGNATLRLLVFYAAVIPLTNSALTNSLNGDNRLLPAAPVAAGLAGYAAALLVDGMRRGRLLLPARSLTGDADDRSSAAPPRTIELRRWGGVLAAVLVAALLVQGGKFFWDRSADRGMPVDDYLSMHLFSFVDSDPDYRHASQLCLAVSPTRFEYFANGDNKLLVEEQYQYFLPGKSVRIYSSSDVTDGELYASLACDANQGHHFDLVASCTPPPKARFTCPRSGKARLYAENDRVPALSDDGIAFLGVAWTIAPTPTYIP